MATLGADADHVARVVHLLRTEVQLYLVACDWGSSLGAGARLLSVPECCEFG